MLVLSRKCGETIMIGPDIAVTVMDVSGGKVRLGLTAPREVPVHREEIYVRVRHEGEEQAARRELNSRRATE